MLGSSLLLIVGLFVRSQAGAATKIATSDVKTKTEVNRSTSSTEVQATSEGEWVIERFDSDITIHKDTSVTVIETIAVDFNKLLKHGIFRSIPVRYRTAHGNMLDVRLNVEAVTDENGAAWPMSRSSEGNSLKLKIGDPNKTISGKQTYMIRYSLTSVVTQPNEQAELYWNVTGNDWPVSIQKAHATVSAVNNSLTDSICFTGFYGAQLSGCSTRHDSSVATFETTTPLSSREGFTIAVELDPIALVFPTLRERALLFVQDNWLYSVPLITLGVMFALYWAQGRDKQFKNLFHENADVERVGLFDRMTPMNVYGPPENLSPGEVGVLVDEKVHTQDITAILVDLARRGFFSIKELQSTGLFKKSEFELTYQEKDESTLEPFERAALDMLFSAKRLRRTITLSKLGTHEDAFEALNRVRDKLYQHMVLEGFFYVNPDDVRKFWWILAGVFAFIGIVFMAFGEFFGSIGGWVTAWLGSAVIIACFAPFMPARTPQGRKRLHEVVGLREWIRIGVWRERIHEKHNLFEEVLPYTIAFGLTDKFIRAFNDAEIRDLTKGMVWYQGYGSFAVGSFSSSFHSFSHSINYSVSVSLPKSASRGGSAFGGESSGGGGFSGGGFGGGGGGSW